jgi:ligand-binding sensor domain-containing protein/signal transduction histidine kinase
MLAGLVPTSLAAQTFAAHKVFGRYQQAVWQEPQGLPQHTVYGMTKTRDGYLWLATVEGAARFDGVRFTVFDPTNTPEIRGSVIATLVEDDDGTLWLGPDSGGLVRYSAGRFARVTTADGLIDHPRALLRGRRGELWIGAAEGLSRLRDGRVTTVTSGEGLPERFVTALAEDGEGSLWIGTAAGLARLKDGQITAFGARDGLPAGGIRALSWDPVGQLWIGSDGGLVRWANGRFTAGAREGLTEAAVTALCVDKEGTLWVGTGDRGLLRRSGERFVPYSTSDGLPGDRITTIYQDPDNDLWIGTSAGLVRLRDARFDMLTEQDGLARDFSNSVYQDATGTIWVTSHEGLSRYRDGTFRTYTRRDGLPDDSIRSVTSDPQGRVFVSSQDAIAVLDDARFKRWTLPTVVSGARLTAILADRAGALWIGTTTRGVTVQHGREARTYTRGSGLRDDYVTFLFQDRAGAVWVGTFRGGASRIIDGRVTTWSTDDGLANNFVTAFYETDDGTMWIGTHGGGLSRLKDGRLATIDAASGLFNNIVFQILNDDAGNLWMCCNKGIFRASLNDLNAVADRSRSTLTSVAYGLVDGMLSSECVQGFPGGYRMRDGTLWFPTTHGVAVIDPRSRDARPPRVVIERTLVDRTVVPPDNALSVAPGQRNLEIEYTALSWSRPQRIAFRYRMSGLDATWVDAGTRRTAYYPYLPPGSYVFTVIADDGEGVWNMEGASLRVTVLPAFYQTGWFFGALAIAGAGTLGLAWKRRVRQWRRTQAAQQAFARQLIASQEAERKRIAGELHDSLGQHLLIITNRAALGKGFARDAGGPVIEQFDEINQSALQAIGEVRAIAQNLRPINLDRLGLTAAIEEMIEKASGAAGVEFSADVEPIDGVLSADSQIVVYRIIQESINNILKHSGASRANVEVWREDGTLQISVRDNGRGFAERGAATSESPHGSGLGLVGIAERVRMLGGTHSLVSTPAQGTTLHVRIPISQATDDGTRSH